MHWAAPLIGLPWEEGRDGPHSFDCWGLVRYVFREHYGVALPVLELGKHNNESSIRDAVRTTRWAPSDATKPVDRDIVLCWGTDGRHVGVMVEGDRRLQLLHCFNSDRGGQVVWEDISAAAGRGYWGFEFWRHRD